MIVLDYQDQLTLLSDILKNQQQLGYGTTDEFNQIHRLAEALQGQDQLDQNMQQTLASIVDYCANGNCTENATNMTHWIQSIDNVT